MEKHEFDGISILVLSNQPKKYRLVLRQLSNMGISCAAVGNIKKALTHIVAHKPTHIFISVNIPKMVPTKVAKLISTTFNIPAVLFPDDFGYNTTKMLKETSWPYIIHSSFAGASVANMLRYMIKEQNGTLEEGETPEGKSSNYQGNRGDVPSVSSDATKASIESARAHEEEESLYSKKKKVTHGDVQEFEEKKQKRRKRKSYEEAEEEYYAKKPKRRRDSFSSEEEFLEYERDYEEEKKEYLAKSHSASKKKRNSFSSSEDSIREEMYESSEERLEYEDYEDYEDDDDYESEEDGGALESIEHAERHKSEGKKRQGSYSETSRSDSEWEEEYEEEDDEDFDMESFIRASLENRKKNEEAEEGNLDIEKRKARHGRESEDDEVESSENLNRGKEKLRQSDEWGDFQDEDNAEDSSQRKRKNNLVDRESDSTLSDQEEFYTEEDEYDEDDAEYEDYENYEDHEEEGVDRESYRNLAKEEGGSQNSSMRKKKRKKKKKNSSYASTESSVEDQLIGKQGVDSLEDLNPEEQTLEKSDKDYRKKKGLSSTEETFDSKKSEEENLSWDKKKSKRMQGEGFSEEDSEGFSSEKDSLALGKRKQKDSQELDDFRNSFDEELDHWQPRTAKSSQGSQEKRQNEKPSYQIHESEDYLGKRKEPPATEDHLSDWKIQKPEFTKEESLVVLKKAMEQAIHQVVSRGKQQGVEEEIRSMVVFAAKGQHFNGYILLAAGHDNIVATELSGPFRRVLLNQLLREGYKIELLDPFYIQTARVKYEEMMQEISNFSIFTNHVGEDVGVSFIEVEPMLFEARFEKNPAGEPSYFKIEIDSIPADTPVEFDMFIQFPQNNKFIRYVKEGGIVDQEQLDRIKASTISAFHLEGNAVKKWRSQMASEFLNTKFGNKKKKAA